LIILERDFEAKKMGYTILSYLAVLNEAIPTLWELGLIFIQDNTPIYTARAVKEFFVDNAIDVIKWPPYSPNLNPLENLWNPLKQGVFDVRPNIIDITGGDEKVRAILGPALIES
jgi:hypothetical protein